MASISYIRFFMLTLFFGGLLKAISADSGLCMYHQPKDYSDATVDEYVFHVKRSGVTNLPATSPFSGNSLSGACKTVPIVAGVGKARQNFAPFFRACESSCNELLNFVRPRNPRSSCTYNPALSTKYACGLVSASPKLSKPASPVLMSNGFQQVVSTGNTGFTGAPGTTSSEGIVLDLGTDSGTGLSCESGEAHFGGEKFCRSVCLNVAEQVALRLEPGAPPAEPSARSFITLWAHAEAWTNCN